MSENEEIVGSALDARDTHLRFLAAMERVDRAIRLAPDLERLLSDLLDTALDIFDCDRAWLLHPCDPGASSWRVPMERNRPEWPGALVLAVGDIPMRPDAAEVFRAALEAGGPVRYDPESGELPEDALRFDVQSQVTLAVHPKVGKPWLLGLHVCHEPRIWTGESLRIFHEFGRRMADGLSSALTLRDLRESEARFRTLVEHAPEAIVVLDMDRGRFADANPNAVALFGHDAEQLLQLGLLDISSGTQDGADTLDDMERHIREAMGGEAPVFEWIFADATGQHIPCEVRLVRLVAGDRHLIRGSITDIRERKQLEAQLRQAQKMEALGMLAGGIAHDFNNLLVAIIGHGEMLASGLEPTSGLAHHAGAIAEAGSRAAQLVGQLLAFSRKQVLAPKTLDLNGVVADTASLLRRLLGEVVELDIELAERPVVIRADRGQLEQVIVNLATNARDAMEGGGRLTVATSCRAADGAGSHLSCESGRLAVLEVADTGTGIDPEVLDRIFEPFFTTKDLDRGTGLGLSTVYGIVKQSGGEVLVSSDPGTGTRFEVLLPATGGRPAPRVSDDRKAEVMGGDETILVVEDDPHVAAVVTEVLTRYGYTIHQASDGEQALELVERMGARSIDLLFTDVVMPKMGGPELALVLRAERPGLRVMYCSGYADESLHDGSAPDPAVGYLQKPFPSEGLARAVRELLDREVATDR